MENGRLSEVQSSLLEMLKWFHTYCEQHDLTYYMVGGTMLGAMRHKGFIPWDDDLDVALPRKDYDRLYELMRASDGDGKYVIESVRDLRPDYYFPHAKIFDTTTTLTEHKRKPVVRGLYLDLFPIDGTGNTYEESMRFFQPIAKRLDFLATRVCGVRKGRAWIKNAAVMAAGLIPDVLYPNQKRMVQIDDMCRSKSLETCIYAANLYGIKRKKEIMKKAYFGSPVLYDFEDMKAYGVECPQEYLQALFGDWKQLPPAKEQVTHHDYEFCDLHHGYMDKNVSAM